MVHIEVLARGVLLHQGRLLLVVALEDGHASLPGGHVEFGEPAKVALRRELREELGLEVQVGDFLGAVEHAYADSRPHAEINLLFRLHCPALTSERPPVALESHIGFRWQPLDDLAAAGLLPEVMCQVLPRWLEEGRPAGWAGDTDGEPAAPGGQRR